MSITTTSARPQTTADLRAELDDVRQQLEVAEARWAALDSTPQAFTERLMIAGDTNPLRAREAALVAAIERRDAVEAALASLRPKEAAAYDIAVHALAALVASLPTDDPIRHVLQACATANAMGSVLERYDGSRPHPSLNALRELDTAFNQLTRDFRRLAWRGGNGADATAFASELAVLTGEEPLSRGEQPSRKEHDDATS